MITSRLTRTLAAILLVAGGIVHFNLWKSGYQHIPKVGPLFIANFAGSIALAVAVIVTRRPSVSFAGMAFAAGSLMALLLSRTVGVLGFTETIWTSQAVKTLASEIGVILTLGVGLFLQLRADRTITNRASQMRLAPAVTAARRGA